MLKNYASKTVVKQAELFREIGWDDLIDHAAYENTCAIRMSLALIKCDVKVPGRMAINKGKYKGRLIEPGQARLAQSLTGPSLLGVPEKYRAKDAESKIGKKSGVIAFWSIPGYLSGAGGHIDLVSGTGVAIACSSGCYFNAAEVWFWPL
jgi:hypothetical protein